MRQFHNRQRGIGIVEIMVALTISLVLTAGVLQFYLGSKQSYRLEDALSRVQETGRFAISAIARDARMADFWGCGARVGLTLVNDLDSAKAATYLPFEQAVFGTNNDGLGGSDTLTLRYARSIGVNVVTHSLAGPFTVDPSVRKSTVDLGDYVVLCNAVVADIVQITKLGSAGTSNNSFEATPGINANGPAGACTQAPGTTAGCFATKYASEAELAVATQVTYRIQNGTSGQPGLFVRINNSNAQELIEGVEDMQVLYGEDTDGDRQANRYLQAGAAGLDMDRIVSVQVSLLVRSLDANVTNEPQSITFNGTAAAGTSDRRLRQIFTATLTLRNRVL